MAAQRRLIACTASQWHHLLQTGALSSNREFSQLALSNKALAKGPGGRSSVSGITATVFGATGFLGRYVVNALAKTGSRIVLPYRCDDLDCQHLRLMGDLGQIAFLKDFDIRVEDQVEHAIHKSNIVVNLLGMQKETPNFAFEDVHVAAAARIAQIAAKTPGVERLLHVSCLGAGPDAPSRRLTTKALGDEEVLKAFPTATVFRPGPMVGVEDHLTNNFATLAKKLPLMPLFDGGHAKLQPVYVRDVADAMASTLSRKDVLGKTYYLAGPTVFTLRQFATLMYETMRENPHFLYLPASVAKMLATPFQKLSRTVPLPVNPMFTADNIAEWTTDIVQPAGPDILTFADLGMQPKRVDVGTAIEHIRHFRAGGYDFGTTGENQSTGGAGYGGTSKLVGGSA